MSAPRLIALIAYGRDTAMPLSRESGVSADLAEPYEFDEREKLIRAPE